MNQSRYANTSFISNRNNQSTLSGTNDRLSKITEKLNKLSVRLYIISVCYRH